MEMELVSEALEFVNHLTWLSARENIIDFCLREHFNTYTGHFHSRALISIPHCAVPGLDGKGKGFLSSSKRPSLIFSGYWGFFRGVKWPGREVNHLSPSGAEVRMRGCTSLLPLHVVLYLLCLPCDLPWWSAHDYVATPTKLRVCHLLLTSLLQFVSERGTCFWAKRK
jgi:hypothetical protein